MRFLYRKSLFKNVFDQNFFICQLIFKMFAAQGSHLLKFGAEIGPHSQCQKVCFFSQSKVKNSQLYQDYLVPENWIYLLSKLYFKYLIITVRELHVFCLFCLEQKILPIEISSCSVKKLVGRWLIFAETIFWSGPLDCSGFYTD